MTNLNLDDLRAKALAAKSKRLDFETTMADEMAFRKAFTPDVALALLDEIATKDAALKTEQECGTEYRLMIRDLNVEIATLKAQAGDHDRLKRAIADGFSNGNEQYDEASEPMRGFYDMAAHSVSDSLAARQTDSGERG